MAPLGCRARAPLQGLPGWRLAVNRFNMAKLEAPDGRAIKGRIVYADPSPPAAAAAAGATAAAEPAAAADEPEVVRVESVWGSAGLAVGLGFAPVALEVLLWPASAGGGAALAVAAIGGAAGAAEGAPLPGARDLVFVREEGK